MQKNEINSNMTKLPNKNVSIAILSVSLMIVCFKFNRIIIHSSKNFLTSIENKNQFQLALHRNLPKVKMSDPNSSNLQSRSPLLFSYDFNSPNGPENWQNVDISNNEWLKYINKPSTNLHKTKYNQCNSNRLSSPINLIHPDEECTATHEIITKTNGPNQCRIHDFTFSIIPSALRATAPSSNESCIRPTIDLPNGFPFPWVLDFIEIKTRSEHLLNGRRYDGEMIMAHVGREEHNSQVSFVSIMLDSTTAYYEDDKRLGVYIKQWDDLHRRNARNCKIPIQKKFSSDFDEYNYSNDSSDLTSKPFPYDIWPTDQFYRYRGSITIPPCTAMVNWRILDTPLKISRRQFKRIAYLINNAIDPKTCQYITAASTNGEVNRPLQRFDYENQDLVHCTYEDF